MYQADHRFPAGAFAHEIYLPMLAPDKKTGNPEAALIS